jgi:nucleoside-diphosphate-sugar epimerase
MKVLVIGSRGYIGRHLMADLADGGIEVVGVSSADGSGIDPDSGLLGDGFTVPVGTTAVVYMAQSPCYREVPQQASHVLAVNSLSVVRAATAARNAGVTRFIYFSTGTVYAPMFSPISEDAPVRRDSWYVLSKLHGEEALALFRSDMDVIVVRPFGVYGPGQSGRLVPNLIQSVKAGRPITLQARPGSAEDKDGLKISLCFIDDVIQILIGLLRNGGQACLNLAGPEAVSIRAMAEAIGSRVGREPVFELSASLRDSDLIADTRLLTGTLAPTFTSLGDGLAKAISAQAK